MFMKNKESWIHKHPILTTIIIIFALLLIASFFIGSNYNTDYQSGTSTRTDTSNPSTTSSRSNYEEFFIFDKFEDEFDIQVRLVKEGNVGVAKLDLTSSFIDQWNDTAKGKFVTDFLISSFVELSEKIDAENYRITYTYTTEDGNVFQYHYITPGWNIENNIKNEEGIIYNKDFVENTKVKVT